MSVRKVLIHAMTTLNVQITMVATTANVMEDTAVMVRHVPISTNVPKKRTIVTPMLLVIILTGVSPVHVAINLPETGCFVKVL